LAIVNETMALDEKRAKRFWIALVLFLFVIQSTIMGLVIHLAIGDPSAAIVPDYHNAALNWDATRRRHEAADRLGWSVAFSASDIADDSGRRAIELNIRDEAGRPVDALTVAGKLYHHARANDLIPVELNSVGEGRYLALVPAGRAGLWQLDLEFENAPEPMAHRLTFNVEGS
jgi:nitrogen fixation protein FixH